MRLAPALFLASATACIVDCRPNGGPSSSPQDTSTIPQADPSNEPALKKKAATRLAMTVDGGYACADAGIDGGITCNGVCVDPSSNNANCGFCGNHCNCTTGFFCMNCVNGACCIEAQGTCQYAQPGTCCPGTTCAITPQGTYACQ